MRLLAFFMYSCANLYYKYAQSNSYRVLKFQIAQKKMIRILPCHEFHIISEHVNTQINLTRRRYDFFQFHVGQFSYRASCKGDLTISKQTLRLAGLKLSFSEIFFHVETSQFL